MKNSKFLLVGAIGAAITPAFADDAGNSDATSPTYMDMDFSQRWSGIYVGVSAGGIGHFAEHTGYEPAGFDVGYSWPNQSDEAFGGIFGVQIGYNYQLDHLVIGFEADISTSSAAAMVEISDGYSWLSQRTEIDALGTARLRVGYAFDRTLVYATGGLAVGKINDSIQAEYSGDAYSWSDGSRWEFGYVVGAGAEFAINDKWSVKGEGLFYDLGEEDHESTFVDNYAWGSKVESQGVIGRLGLNYRF